MGDNLSKISSLKNVTTNGVPAKNKTVLRRIIDNGLQNLDMILSKKKKKLKTRKKTFEIQYDVDEYKQYHYGLMRDAIR